MKKSEIVALTDVQLLAHFASLEATMVKEENFQRGLTNKTVKDFQWSIDEVSKRFNVDKEELAKNLQAGHLLKLKF